MSKKIWKTAFWLSWVVLGLTTFYIYPRSCYATYEPQEWAVYFHMFPLSLFLSLQVWLGYQAFREPIGASRWRYKLAFWLNCIPSGLVYFFSVQAALSMHGDDIFMAVIFLSIPTVVFFVLQLLFAFLAFRR